MSEHEVELLRFENPTGSEMRIFLPKVPWSRPKTKEALQEHLREIMTKYGLVHSLYVNEKDESSTEDVSGKVVFFYAAAEFYSALSARKARLFSHLNLCVEGVPVKVLSSTRKTNTDLPLSLWRCEALANYYLGFNGWNSEVLYHRKESQAEENDGKRIRVKYCSAVRLTFKSRPSLQVEGAGMAEEEYQAGNFSSKAACIAKARKWSRAAASQNAFAKVILVVVDGRKSTVELDATKVDPFFYDPLWEKHEAEVNMVEYDVVSEEEEEKEVAQL